MYTRLVPRRTVPSRVYKRKNPRSERFVRTLQRAYRKKKMQARFAVSKKQYNLNKAVSAAMSRMSETKLLALNEVNPGAANGTPSNVVGTGTNARAYAWRGILGGVPINWDAGLVNLGGVVAAQGDSSQEHIGNYVYYKKTSINLQLDMVYNADATKQLQFRMIVCKARQAVLPSGTTDLPQTTLFINQIGNQQGFSSTGSLAMSTFEVMNNPLNKRDWVICRDQKFFMNNPTSMEQGKYPSRKNFRITLPHYKKTKLNTGGTPLDYDYRYMIYIFATVPGALSDAQLPDDFRVAARGTTSFTDN